MERMKGVASFRNHGKQPFLPPKFPFPSIVTPAYGDYGPSGSIEVPGLREEGRQDQCTSSESFSFEEQLCWLEELLNEPETPVNRGGHRRSSSDSFAYMDASRINSNAYNLAHEDYRKRNFMSTPLWGSHEFDLFKDARHYYAGGNSSGRLKDKVWVSGLNLGSYSNSLHAAKGKGIHPGSCGSTSKGSEALASSACKKLGQEVSPEDLKSGSEKKDVSHAKHTQLETDSKRVKQQFAQRSRVRKLQYIAELESCIHALQAEGLEVSAELEFVDQQNLILILENKVLKQRLHSLTKEQLIKQLHHEMLEREIARLQELFQQQQQQPLLQPSVSHAQFNSIRDLNSQFANISLRHTEMDYGRDPVTGLRIY